MGDGKTAGRANVFADTYHDEDTAHEEEKYGDNTWEQEYTEMLDLSGLAKANRSLLLQTAKPLETVTLLYYTLLYYINKVAGTYRMRGHGLSG